MKFDFIFDKDVVLLQDYEDIEPYKITMPEPPPIHTITNYGLPKEEQFFQADKVPAKIWKLTNRVNNGKITREEATMQAEQDPECREFILSVFKKIHKGTWQFIYGHLFYIPCRYYFYLNWYEMPIEKRQGAARALPDFRVPDLQRAWWQHFCVYENPDVYGGIEFMRRRVGKTFYAGKNLLFDAITNRNHWSGIQSKTQEDARTVFKKAVVYQFRRLPFFLKPEFDTSGKMKSDLTFEAEDVELSMESKIDYQSSTATAYDGQKLGTYLMDECGKMTAPTNPIDIWDKVKMCLFIDGRIVGKAFLTTTVEEMEKGGGEEFKWLWTQSSRIPKDDKMNELGETLSGLIPYFVSSYDNMFFDQWGFPIVDTPRPEVVEWRLQVSNGKDRNAHMGGKEFVDKKINSLKGADKVAEIRKMPRNIKEAFQYLNKQCLYDIEIINRRLSMFLNGYGGLPYNYKFGYFTWEGEKFGRVKFVEVSDPQHPLAKWHITYMPPAEKANQWFEKNGKKHPSGNTRFTAGADPFKLDTEQITNKRDMSLGAGHIYAFYDPEIDPFDKPREEWVTKNFCAEYLFRPPRTDDYCEDMLMACIYYGCKMFPEFNVDWVDRYFRANGFDNYLKYRAKPSTINGGIVMREDKKQSGGITSDSFKPSLIPHGQNFVLDSAMYCPFNRTLEHMRDMTYSEWNEYDLGVSALYCLFGGHDTSVLSKDVPKKRIDYKDIGLPQHHAININR